MHRLLSMRIHLSYFNLGIDMKQGGTQIAPELAHIGSTSNGIINFWAYERSTVILPCISYGNPPALTRYVSVIYRKTK